MRKVFEFFALLLYEGIDKKDKGFREFVCLKPKQGFYCMHETILCHDSGKVELARTENTQIHKSDLALCDNIKIDPQILISLN